jgi:hypothetical protein
MQLTVKEWQSVQQIWNAINELYPVLNETYRAIYGVNLAKVEAKPLIIEAADGTVEIQGGYYPLIFDRDLSKQAAEQESGDIMNRMEGVLRPPKPKSGMTNERTGGTLPPRLDMGIIQQHAADTIHYATHAIALRDINQLFNVPEYQKAFEDAMGKEAYDDLLPWLRYIARPEGRVLNSAEKGAEKLARLGTVFTLGLNFKSALLQLTSVGSSIKQIGLENFAKGAFSFITRPSMSTAEVNKKSAYMQSRGMMLDASLAQNLKRLAPVGARGVTINGKFYTLEDMRNASFGLIRAFDAVIAYPTWIGAYSSFIGMQGQSVPQNTYAISVSYRKGQKL